ncbi:MAG: toll/interleukin-1 receptor domain-containing protein [Planctomycetia bacterium]
MPRIFLSYASEDHELAERLAKALENRPDISVWRDKDDLRGGEEWEPRLNREIADSDFFVPLISSAFVARPRFAHNEVRTAIQEATRRGATARFIVPVRLDECDLYFDELRTLHCIDLFRDPQQALHLLFSALGAYGETPGAETKLRVTSHVARFVAHPRMHYFVTVVNISDRPVSISHVHYRDPGQFISVAPKGRRLPYRLDLADAWLTYLPVALVPAPFRDSAFDKFFVRLATGEIKRSAKETSILMQGTPSGGPIIFPKNWDDPYDY